MERERKPPESGGEREPVLCSYSRQEFQISHELALHWVHSSIRELIPRRHCRFVIVGPRVIVNRLSHNRVDASDSHTINRLGLGLGLGD